MKKIQQKEIALRASNLMVEQQTKLIGDLSPKAKVYDQVMDAKGEMSFRKVAAVLNIPYLGRNILFGFLRYMEILDKDNIPYRQYEDAGYFRVIASTVNVGTEGNVKLKEIFITKVTTKGLAYITKKVDENYDNYCKERGRSNGSKSKTKKTFKEGSQTAESSGMAT
jgi:phage antirepressor YoqD-like protein